MQKRTIVIFLAFVSCATGFWLVGAQRQQLAALYAEPLAPEVTPKPGEDVVPGTGQDSRPAEASTTTAGEVQAGLSELLRLRSQVTMLSARVREMSSITQENARLRGQLTSTAQNAGTGIQLPPGYIRRSLAKPSGYGTPEDALQSFLYGLNNHDATNVRTALTPAAAERFRAMPQEEFFKGTDQVPGFFIQSRAELPDGIIELKVEVVPGLPAETIRCQQINGEWKLAIPF